MNTSMPADVAHSLRCELACESLRICGTLRLKVTGWSMLPTIWPGDTLLITRVNEGYILRGEIALYRRQERLFIHRVIADQGTEEGLVLTQGDGMPEPDPPLLTRDLLGKVEFILRHGKTIPPSRSLGVPQRIFAGLLRRSETAARLAVKMRRCYGVLRPSAQEN